MKVIDIHSHVVPDGFPALPSGCGCGDKWPHLHHGADHKAAVVIGGKEFRRIDSRSWDPARRVADMAEEDVLMQVLSPMPELLGYWLEPAASLAMARHVNAAIGQMVAAHPQRFAGLGMVPLQDVQMATKELATLKHQHGLRGVEIGSNILGKPPGHADFDDFYAECQRLDLCLFVHALHPLGGDRLVGPPALQAFINFPTDTGLAAASMITGRTLQKFPKLRVAFSHGGGTLAAFLPRLHQGWLVAPGLDAAFASPRDEAHKFYVDNLVFDIPLLRHLIATFGSTQVMAGSDYPYMAGQRFPGQPFEALALAPAEQQALACDNALRYLGLPAG